MTKTERLTAKIAEADKRTTEAENKAKALKNELEALEAKKLELLISSSRASDNRRKFLVGAWLLAEIEKDEQMRLKLNQGLEKYLTRPDDRRLFNLEVKVKPVVVTA